jgi:predicted phosphodiesterase
VIRRTASRFGLLADVHANLQALEAVLRFLDSQGIEEIWCLGDVVGYGGDPAACVEIVRERCAGTVRGNHDAATVQPALREAFNPHARAAIERQARLLDEETLRWLSELPPLIELDEVMLLHGSVVDPDGFPYVLGMWDAVRELEALPGRWGFYGHTHVPAVWHMDLESRVEEVSLSESASGLPLDGPGRYLINPGAVGQPRDGDARAACAIFDRGSALFHLARLDYDVAAAQAAIHRAGMPPIEAERLGRGR